MSFYTALTGLNAATAQLSVTSNNIANVGTTGFKRSRADFGDIFATSPLQKASSVIGQGVSLKSVTQEFSQGNIQVSASSLDIAITGDGFFPLKSADGLQDIYTRNGTFVLDSSLAVVNSAGQALQAATVDSSGKADLTNLKKLIIPKATTGDARQTTNVELGLNLPASGTVITAPFDKNDATTYNLNTAVTVFDAGGNSYLATVYYKKTKAATPADPNNKWQTYVYIGDTKLDELLIQASDEKGGKYYVNKYGEIKSEGDIPAENIARGVTKLFKYNDLKNPEASSPATVAGDPMNVALVTDWKNGFDVQTKLGLLSTPVVPAAQSVTMPTLSSAAQGQVYAFTDGTRTFQVTAPSTDATDVLNGLRDLINASPAPYTASVSGSALVLASSAKGVPLPTDFAPKFQSMDTSSPSTVSTSAAAVGDSRTLPVISSVTAGNYYSFDDGTTTLAVLAGPSSTSSTVASQIAAKINAASLTYTASVSGSGALVLTKTGTNSIADTDFTIKSEAMTTAQTSGENFTAGTSNAGDITFKLNVDGSKLPVTVDLSYLNGSTTKYTGAEMAAEITNVINKQLGDERYFDFTSLKNNGKVDLLKVAVVDTAGASPTAGQTVTISLTEPPSANADFTSLSAVKTSDVVAAIQRKINAAADATSDATLKANLKTITVGFDPKTQSFTFKSSTAKDVYVSSGGDTRNDLLSLEVLPTLTDGATGQYGVSTPPNGALIRDSLEQRYGVKVTFDDTARVFRIASGQTGDSSSIKISNASATANALFGFPTSTTGTEVTTSATPLRGIASSPAVLQGNPIGLNINNKFRVDASNNSFVVTVDNVTGLVTIPPKADYTAGEFKTELERRINALADSFGRTVSGAKVDILQNSAGQSYFQFTTGTSGNDSFLKVSANSIWGLADVPSARGSTSQWLTPPQARNDAGFPLYVDRDGLETTDPGSFSEAETLNLWSPIFLEKGELTFDTAGKLVSPLSPTSFKATTIGDTGATLKFAIDYNGSTQYSSPFSVLSQNQNGRPEGDLIGLDIGDNGLVSANYSNGTQKNLAKVVLANFTAPTGLRQIGDASFYATSKSGTATLGEAGTAGFGTVKAGARERANVDLTSELIELITAQRNFQANAKAIETNNTLTQAIINLRS